jgi:hypothetical protein
LADKNATSIPEKNIERIRETRMPVIRRKSILIFPLAQIINKKQDQRQHYRPISMTKSKRNYLVYSNDKENNRE